MQNSKIEWTDKTWNPVTGCTKVSQGCKNCYAEKIYERFNGKDSFKHVTCHEERLTQPLRWKQPAMVFVNSMSDLFHEDVPFEFVDKVFAVMALCNNHTFQVLTKRPERMLKYFLRENLRARVMTELDIIGDDNPKFFDACCEAACNVLFDEEIKFKNVWLGVSVEDQKAADQRIPLLLQVSAAVRFLSCEPLLGLVDISAYLSQLHSINDETDKVIDSVGKGIQWVICGGESGNKARPMHPDWARSLRDQCYAEGVPFFFKQWGEWMPKKFHDPAERRPKDIGVFYKHARWFTNGENVNEEVYPDAQNMIKVGKKKAGRLLDGRLWNEMPKTTFS